MIKDLFERIEIFSLPLSSLSDWLSENNLWSDFSNDQIEYFKKKWKEESNSSLSSCFSDSDLLFWKEDIIILKVENKENVKFLAKSYQLKEQIFCQNLFKENKNIILLTKDQWENLAKNKKNEESCFVLFKDEESAKKTLEKWFKSLEKSIS